MPNISRVSHPNDLALGLLTLLAGFGQGFAGGRIQKSENQKAEKEKALARQDKERAFEYQMRQDLGAQGERALERSIESERFAETSKQNQKRIDIEQQRADEEKQFHGQQFIKDLEDQIFKDKTLKEDQRYHNLWAAIEKAKIEVDKAREDRLAGVGGSGTGSGKGKFPLTKEQFAIGVLQDLFKDDIALGSLRDPKKREDVFNAIDVAYDRFMKQAEQQGPNITSAISGQGPVASSDKLDAADRHAIFNPSKAQIPDYRSESTAVSQPPPLRTVPQLNAMPGPPLPDYSNIEAGLGQSGLVIPLFPDTTGFRGDIGGAPIPSIQAYNQLPTNVPSLQSFTPVDINTVLQGLLAGYNRKFARPVSFEPMRTVK